MNVAKIFKRRADKPRPPELDAASERDRQLRERLHAIEMQATVARRPSRGAPPQHR